MLAVVTLMVGAGASAAETPRWKEEWQRVVEAAKKEGQVSLYGGQEITHPDIVAAFNKEFPFIKVTMTSGRGGDLVLASSRSGARINIWPTSWPAVQTAHACSISGKRWIPSPRHSYSPR